MPDRKCAMKKFELFEDDYYAIDIAKSTARRFLGHPQIKPSEIIGLGSALYALERLPIVTPGSNTEFGVIYRSGTDNNGEMRYIDFLISEDTFEISRGGSVYNEAVGGDSFSRPGWLLEVGGHRCTECDLCYLEDSIAELINLGAEITVNDDSQIEYAE